MPEVRAHAKLSCSGAKRWMNCPGSVKLGEDFPNESSIYADEGTLAHDLGEYLIKFGQLPQAKLEAVDKFYAAHPELDYTTAQMAVDVNGYADFVQGQFVKEKEVDPDTRLMTEEQVSLEKWIPGGFGTSDVIIARWGKLHIIDLKFGKGVPVSAEDNPQLRLYALGALAALDEEFHINDVQMTIYQPRVGNISDDYITADDLYSWGYNVVKPAADLTQSDDAPFKAGSWCQFCPAKAVCRARSTQYLDLAEYMRKNSLSNEEISEILALADGLTKWIEDIKAGAIKSIERGDIIPGWKVVEGISRRKYTLKDKDIIDLCVAAGFDRDKVCSVKAKGITDMEKLLGKDKFKEILGGYVEKPAGKPTLAVANE